MEITGPCLPWVAVLSTPAVTRFFTGNFHVWPFTRLPDSLTVALPMPETFTARTEGPWQQVASLKWTAGLSTHLLSVLLNLCIQYKKLKRWGKGIKKLPDIIHFFILFYRNKRILSSTSDLSFHYGIYKPAYHNRPHQQCLASTQYAE